MATKTKTKKAGTGKGQVVKTKKAGTGKGQVVKQTKLEVAQAIAILAPELFDGTPEALAKRSTMDDLIKMRDEAQAIADKEDAEAAKREARETEEREAKEKAELNRAMSTQPTQPEPEVGTDGFERRPGSILGPIGDGMPTLGENTQDPAWPSSIVKGVRVLVVESEDGDPAFEGVVDEEDRAGFLVSIKDKDGAAWWVDPRDCCVVVSTQEAQPATGLPHLVDVDPKTGDDIEPPPAVDVAGDPLMAALGVTPETVDSFADLIDPAYEARIDEAARADNVRRRAQQASTTKEPTKPKRELPPVGTKLTHDLSNGAAERAGTTTQTAEVVADGILFEGRTYPSLTAAGSAASVRAGLSSHVNGWAYWGLAPSDRACWRHKSETRAGKAPKVSAADIKTERDALMASLEGLAPVIVAILTTPEDTPIGVTNINKMLQAWTQKHDTVWRPFAGSAVASAPTVTPPPA